MSPRGFALIAVALVLSAGLLGVQLASGGGDFVPQRPADPCQERGRTGQDDLESLAETVVLTGLDEAACKLGVSRERLLLALPSQKDRAELARETGTDERGLAQALKDGLRTGVDRLDEGRSAAEDCRPSCRRSPTSSASRRASSTRSPTAWSTTCSRPPTCCAGRSTRST